MALAGLLVVVAAAMGFSWLLLTAWRAEQRLHEEVVAFRATEQVATAEARLRGVLARLSWLGPLRPRPPPDPREECGAELGLRQSWWEALWKLKENRRRLACLQERRRLDRRRRLVSFVMLGLDVFSLALFACMLIVVARMLWSALTPGQRPRWSRQVARKLKVRFVEPLGEGGAKDDATPCGKHLRCSELAPSINEAEGDTPPDEGGVRGYASSDEGSYTGSWVAPLMGEATGSDTPVAADVDTDANFWEEEASPIEGVEAACRWPAVRLSITPHVSFIVHLTDEAVPSWFSEEDHHLLSTFLVLETHACRDQFLTGNLGPQEVHDLLKESGEMFLSAPSEAEGARRIVLACYSRRRCR